MACVPWEFCRNDGVKNTPSAWKSNTDVCGFAGSISSKVLTFSKTTQEKLVKLIIPSAILDPGRLLSIAIQQWNRDTLSFDPYPCFLPHVQRKMASDGGQSMRFIAQCVGWASLDDSKARTFGSGGYLYKVRSENLYSLHESTDHTARGCFSLLCCNLLWQKPGLVLSCPAAETMIMHFSLIQSCLSL